MTYPYNQPPYGQGQPGQGPPGQQPFGQPQPGQPYGQPQQGQQPGQQPPAFGQPSPSGGFPAAPGQQPFPQSGGFPPQQPGQAPGQPGGPGFPGGPQPGMGPRMQGQAQVLVPGSQIRFPHTGPLVLGTMGSRFLARLVDGLIIGLPLGTLFLVIQFALAGTGAWWVGLIAYPIIAVSMFVYEGVMLSSRGATVGKSVAGLKLVTEQSVTMPEGGTGSGPAFTRMATMFLPGLIPCVGFLASFLMILSPFFDEQARQGWHDKAAKTYVISTKPMPMY